MTRYLLGIDQGTSSTWAVIFTERGLPVKIAQREFDQKFPKPGWVEQNPEDIWQTTLATCRQVCRAMAIDASDLIAIGISNQRETTLVWDKNTGEAVHAAIGWQDSRTADWCSQADVELQASIRSKTGLILNPYFSATKLQWLLDNVPGVRERAERGELLFGTIECFLLWKLTGGHVHKTDATNASRTLLFNIHTGQWDPELLQAFNIPAVMLPEVVDNSGAHGETKEALFNGAVPITGLVGDQQGALVGQACFAPGMIKSTYGTGAFIVGNTGQQAIDADAKLLTTVAYQLNGETTYALEGSIFVAGSAIKWLRDKLQLLKSTDEIEALIKQAHPDSEAMLVPSFTGLGAPFWQPNTRAQLSGLTLDTSIADIVKATVEASVFRTRDVLDAFAAYSEQQLEHLRIDGGMVVNDWFAQSLADTLNVTVERPKVTETSVLGAVYLAGLQAGVFDSLQAIAKIWQREREFSPKADARLAKRYQRWQRAIQCVQTL